MTQSAAPVGPTESWATFASDIAYQRLPSALVSPLKSLVLDTVGVALAASTLGECCDQVASVVRDNPGAPECTVLGYAARAGNLMAAFANGALAHALNFDALGHAGEHTGVAAVIAPLTIAEQRGKISGKEFLAAIAVAAEFTARLMGALAAAGVDANEKFLEGQLLSYFGAAAGAGRVLRFTPEKMHSVLGLALMQASGTRQVSFEGGPAKAIYGAYANHGAVLSALLAQQGIDARCAVLDGRAGVFRLFYDGKHDPSVLLDGLGERYLSTDVQFKPWPTSNMLHPFIEACQDLRAKHGIDTASIRDIRVRVGTHAAHWLEPEAERRNPSNGATAANSIYFGVAKTLALGNVTLADFTPQGMADPASRRLADLMHCTVDPAVGKGASVEVVLNDGQSLVADVGARSRPMSESQIVAKFRDCAQHAARPIAEARLDEFVERVMHLEREADAGALLALLGNRS